MRAIAVFVTALLLAACKRDVAEPGRAETATSASAAPAVLPLSWEPPPMWPPAKAPGRGPEKAVYKVPRAGAAKADGELTVLFFGTGSLGDPAGPFGAWPKQFEGPDAPRREPLEGAAYPVEMIEMTGKFKTTMGPPRGPGGKPPVEVLRDNYRLLAAVVKTPDRGNWFFKLTGPEDTVQSARSAFYALVRSAK